METDNQNISPPKSRRIFDFLILIIFIAVSITVFLVFNHRDEGAKEKIVWKFDTGIEKGELSEPLVQNGNIFISVNVRGKSRAYVMSVGQDGKERWRAQFDSETELLGGGYDEVRILGFSDENAYIYKDGFISVLNSQNGNIINKYAGGGFYHDGLIFSIKSEGTFLEAVDADNGSSKWRFIFPERTFFNGFDGQYTYGNNSLYLALLHDSNDDGQTDQGTIVALDLTTGQKKWETKTSTSGKSISNLYYYNSQILYRTAGENEVLAIDGGTGEKIDPVKLQAKITDLDTVSTFIDKDGGVFIQGNTGSDLLFFFGLDDGALKWKYNFQNNRIVGLESDKSIYLTSVREILGSGRGRIDVIDPTGKKVWHKEFGGDASISKPVLSEDRVYVTAGNSLRDGEFLYALSK